MDRILIILKKENGPRASSAPALVLNTIIFKYVYSYMKQISGERLQDHWSSGFCHVMMGPLFASWVFRKGIEKSCVSRGTTLSRLFAPELNPLPLSCGPQL